MNGLLSGKPSPGAVRLVVGGFVLMAVQTYLLMLAPGLAEKLGVTVWIGSVVPAACFIGALVGPPDHHPTDWRRRNGR